MSDELHQMQHPLGLKRLGYAGLTLTQPALRWRDGAATPSEETVAEEVPVALVYNGQPHAVMMASPADLEDFAVGFSLTEELVAAPAEVLGIEVQRYSLGIELQLQVSAAAAQAIAGKQRSLTGRTGCGICGSSTLEGTLKTLHRVPSVGQFAPEALHRAFAALAARQDLNQLAGTVHAAGLARPDGTLDLVREDVGRHNALDKLVGALARRGAPQVGDGFVMVTSRASFEMVQKATVVGAPLLAAISGPTGLAVRLAEQAGVTLVGFARGGRHTVYTHPARLAANA